MMFEYVNGIFSMEKTIDKIFKLVLLYPLIA